MSFGTSKSKSKNSSTAASTSDTSNLAYPWVTSELSGTAGQADASSSLIAQLLGMNGDAAQTEGFDKFRDSTGYQFQKQEGMDAITSNAATKGLLGSGATLKALDKYGTGLADSSFNSYLSNLFNLGQGGIDAAKTIVSAGNRSSSDMSSSSTGSSSAKSLSGGKK